MKKIILVSLCLFLSACKSAEEKQKEFIDLCTTSKFTVEQCTFLYVMKKNADDDAASSALLSGMALGTSIGAASGVRR